MGGYVNATPNQIDASCAEAFGRNPTRPIRQHLVP